MKKVAHLIISLIIIISLCNSAYAAGSVPEKVISSADSVVRILAKYSDGYGTGTGFVIVSNRDETLIATNYHVVEDNPYSISVWISENELVTAEILAYSDQKDLCILKLSQPITKKAISFSKNPSKQGDAVYAVGFPAAADILSDTDAHTSQAATITDGIVSALREVKPTQFGSSVKLLQISAAINAGNSGGPLLNHDGAVIGINTYGIVNAQGIFGSIDISELQTFLYEQRIDVTPASSALYWFVIPICVLFIIAAYIFGVKKMKFKKPKTQVIPLRDFMTNHPEGLGVNDAVALLMPVALQLRDLHNNGQLHLQVSPDSILIGSSATLMPPNNSEASRYSSGFAPKEVYSGSSKSVSSDIYSFCAVLQYVSTGIVPVNALQRDANDVYSNMDTVFSEIINKGMNLLPEDRFDSIQSVILKLSPYNIKPYIPTENIYQHDSHTENKQQKKKFFSKKVVIVAIPATIIVAVTIYAASYGAAFYLARTGEYDTAHRLLFIPQITRLHDKQLPVYIEAGSLMNQRRYSEAKELFISLPGFFNADTMSLEADYCYAAQLADSNRFDDAVSIYKELSKLYYKDSENKVLETRYRKGLYKFYEEKDYRSAYMYLGHSDFNSMNGISDVRSELVEILYHEGIELYRQGNISAARSRFIQGYKDSDKYLLLIKARNSSFAPSSSEAKKLIDMFYFEDTAEVILSSHNVAKCYLEGRWQSAVGGKYLNMKDDGHISYNLPYINHGYYYRIENGVVMFYPKDKYYDIRNVFKITALSPNQISVYCYKDGSTYIMNRT